MTNTKTAFSFPTIYDGKTKGIKLVLPEAFENPAGFSIQKGIGVDVMHSIFPIILDRVRAIDRSMHNPESYSQFLETPLTELEGRNSAGDSVSGLDFWKTGRDGATGTYTSAGGKQRLSELLHHLMPELDLDVSS